jgi:hypothetical protein
MLLLRDDVALTSPAMTRYGSPNRANHRARLRQRILSLTAESLRRWGARTAEQMLWQVNTAMRGVLGRGVVTQRPVKAWHVAQTVARLNFTEKPFRLYGSPRIHRRGTPNES